MCNRGASRQALVVSALSRTDSAILTTPKNPLFCSTSPRWSMKECSKCRFLMFGTLEGGDSAGTTTDLCVVVSLIHLSHHPPIFLFLHPPIKLQV